MHIASKETEMKEKILILTIGLPRSGKSTWAKEQNMPIVSPDSVRLALHGEPFLRDAEPMVWAIARYMVKALFLAGHKYVIVDATNTTQKRRDDWEGSEWELSGKVFKTSQETCIERAKESGTEYLIPIIESMNEKADFWELTDDYCCGL